MTADKRKQPSAIILGISSDIGSAVAQELANDGWSVTGTYRTRAGVESITNTPGIDLLHCDIASRDDVDRLAGRVSGSDASWTLFMSAVGRLDPIGRWEELDFDAWQQSLLDNSVHQLRALHSLLPFRSRDGAHAAFFAGGGTNGPFRNYSAYCLGKIALIKMCELLHDEIEDLNSFIVGPGFLPTKIHRPTLANPGAAEGNYVKTTRLYENPGEALTVTDVYRCIRWCMDQGRDVVGGRNIAAAHDPWDRDHPELAHVLRGSPDAWRLRRAAPSQLVGSG